MAASCKPAFRQRASDCSGRAECSRSKQQDIARFLIEGREEAYLKHFFRDFAYNPTALSESEVKAYAVQMAQPGNLRSSLNLYGYIPQMAEQTAELTKYKLKIPMLAWAGRSSFAKHCIESAKAIAEAARGGVIENCGHWVFQEKPDFISGELRKFWAEHNVWLLVSARN